MRQIILLLFCMLTLISCSSDMEIIKAELISQNSHFQTDNSNEYLKIAYNYFENQNYDSVVVYCHKSFAVDSLNWKLYYLYGQASHKTRHTKLATDYYYKALSLCKNDNPNRAKLYFALAENEDTIGNYKLAKQHYLMVVQLQNGSELAQSAYQKMQLLTHTE